MIFLVIILVVVGWAWICKFVVFTQFVEILVIYQVFFCLILSPLQLYIVRPLDVVLEISEDLFIILKIFFFLL